MSIVINWPDSTVLTLVPLNNPTAAPPSVKVVVAPVAVNIGASFTATTATSIVAPLLVPPSPSFTVTSTLRVVVVGSVVLVLI
ncbi:hypothetical protein D3C72_2110660 [compost metagenome]